MSARRCGVQGHTRAGVAQLLSVGLAPLAGNHEALEGRGAASRASFAGSAVPEFTTPPCSATSTGCGDEARPRGV